MKQDVPRNYGTEVPPTPLNHGEKVEHFMIKIAKNGLNYGEEEFEVSTPG
jgi:hypothetical protein